MVSRHFTWKSNFIIILDHFSGFIPTSCWGRPIIFSCQNGCRIFLISTLSIIELDDGKIYRKDLYLMVKTMVSCRFSLKPIQWFQRKHEWSSGARWWQQLHLAAASPRRMRQLFLAEMVPGLGDGYWILKRLCKNCRPKEKTWKKWVW